MEKKTTETFIKEVEKKFPSEVSFEKTEYKDAFYPCIITCPKHGDITIKPHNILRKSRIKACPLCAREEEDKNRNQGKTGFLEKLYKRFPNIKYDFSEAEYVDSHKLMKVICHEMGDNGVEHGAWMIKPSNLYSGYGCPKCAAEKHRQDRRMPYEDYCQLVSEKYGDLYEVDKESYEDKYKNIKIWCNKHKTYFITDSRNFPTYNSHKCPKCIEEDLKTYGNDVPNNSVAIGDDNKIWKDDSLIFNEETWVDVLGFEGRYKCSSEGRFKNINVINRNGEKTNDRLIRVNFTNRLGVVCLGGKIFSASRKLYESFHKVKLPKGYTHTIDHIDNNVRNNRISNLRLGGSIKENMLNNSKTRAKLSARGGAVGVSRIFEFDDLPGEKWVDAIGYEDFYKVSNFGRVAAKDRTLIERNTNIKRVKKGHLMRQAIKYGQYYTVGLIDGNSVHKTHYTHKLVYESFNGRIKEGNQVDHIDSNPLNNKIENLREVTPLENVRNPNSRNKRKIPEAHAGITVNKLDLCGNVMSKYMSINDAARQNGFSYGSMQKWVNGKIDQKRNRLKGFYFEAEK